MMVANSPQATAPQIVTWPCLGRRVESSEALAGLSEEARAGLAQFTFEHLLGYGMSYADAVEIRTSVLGGAGLNGEGAERQARPDVGAMS